MKKNPSPRKSPGPTPPGHQPPGGQKPPGPHHPAGHQVMPPRPAGGRVTPRDPQAEFLSGLLHFQGPIEAALSFSYGDADAAAKKLAFILHRLGISPLSDVQRREYGKQDFVGQETETRAVAKALRASTWVLTKSHESPDQQEHLLQLKPVLRGIELGAEQQKTSALDGLLANQAFGTYIVAQVMNWLREELARKDLTAQQRQDLLSDGAAFLSLMFQGRQSQAGNQATLAHKRAGLAAQLDGAQSQLKYQQTLAAVNQGQGVDPATLLKAALQGQKQAAAAQKEARVAVSDLLAAKKGQRGSNQRDTRR